METNNGVTEHLLTAVFLNFLRGMETTGPQIQALIVHFHFLNFLRGMETRYGKISGSKETTLPKLP